MSQSGASEVSAGEVGTGTAMEAPTGPVASHVLPSRSAAGSRVTHREDLGEGSLLGDVHVQSSGQVKKSVRVGAVLTDFMRSLEDMSDFGAPKEGVMSQLQAEAYERRVMSSLVDVDGVSIMQYTEVQRHRAKASWLAYLALNSGSANGEDGHSSTAESESMVDVGEFMISAQVLRQLMGREAYRYMRARAAEIHAVLVTMGSRAVMVDSRGDLRYPKAEEFVRLMTAKAALLDMEQYWTYCYVGAEYNHRLPPRMRARILAANGAVLAVKGDPGTEATTEIIGKRMGVGGNRGGRVAT